MAGKDEWHCAFTQILLEKLSDKAHSNHDNNNDVHDNTGDLKNQLPKLTKRRKDIKQLSTEGLLFMELSKP